MWERGGEEEGRGGEGEGEGEGEVVPQYLDPPLVNMYIHQYSN